MTNEQDKIVKAFADLPKSEQERLAASYTLLYDWVIKHLPPISNPLDPSILIIVWEIIKRIILISSNPLGPIK